LSPRDAASWCLAPLESPVWIPLPWAHRRGAAHGAELYFVGHSLGGALATLAAFDVALSLLPLAQRRQVLRWDPQALLHELHLGAWHARFVGSG
jgi:hypothetical protein